ncbi:MAG: Rieske (2Fe-2S) protein [Chlamydiota bacterium]|nr:Rieske (2Fe-2S) protein [Chlamydiota bacterium]
MGSNTPLAKVSDIPEGKGIVVMSDQGEEIALFKMNAKIYAINNICPHAGASLAEGEVNDCKVSCPRHAWVFDITTGTCINVPGADVDTYQLRIVDGFIYLKPLQTRNE